MSLKLAASLSIVCGGGPASAERAIVVDLADPAPFAATELAAAMRMRLPADGAEIHVRITRTIEGVRVEAAPGSRDVALHGLAGADAARLVALAASDLLLDDLAAAPELVVRGAPRPAHGAPTTLSITGSAAQWDGVLGGAAVDLAVPVRGYLATADVTGGVMLGGPISLIAGIARLDGGFRTGVLELRAGATIAPIAVNTGAGDVTVLLGGNASLRARLPVTRSSRVVLSAGADVFGTRTQYLVEGAKVLTTPRFAPWLAAGMELAL